MTSKYLGKTKFKGVHSQFLKRNGKNIGIRFMAVHRCNHVIWKSKLFETEIEAAKAYDLRLIELGLEPVNILKRKP